MAKLDLSKADESDLKHALAVAWLLRSAGYSKRAKQIEKMVERKKGFIEVDN